MYVFQQTAIVRNVKKTYMIVVTLKKYISNIICFIMFMTALCLQHFLEANYLNKLRHLTNIIINNICKFCN